MMGRRQVLKSGDEQDAVTRWRHLLAWRAGDRRRIKRRLNRRWRQELRAEARTMECCQ